MKHDSIHQITHSDRSRGALSLSRPKPTLAAALLLATLLSVPFVILSVAQFAF